MKKISYFLLFFIFLLSCEKKADEVEPEKELQGTEVGATLASSAEIANADRVPIMAMGTLPNAFALQMPTPRNQGQQGSCVSWATFFATGSYFMNRNNNPRYSSNSQLASPKYGYNQIRQGQNCGAGSTFPQNLNILRDKGACSWADMPYNETECGLQPNASQNTAASSNKILRWELADKNDITNIKSLIYSGLPIMIIVYVDANFDNLQSPFILTSRGGSVRGAHAITVTGWDDNKNAFKVMNSWGSNWKDGGYLWISYSFFPNAVIASECYVAYPKQSEAQNITQGLVLHLPCDGNANDISGNNNNGTPNNVTLTTDRKGNANRAYQFGGFNNPGFIKVNNSTSLQFSSSFTFSTWVKINNKNGMDGFGSYVNGANSGVQHCIFAKDWDRDKACAFLNYSTMPGYNGFSTGISANSGSVQTNISYNEGQWVHLTYVYGNNQLKLYKNGALVISTVGSLDFTPSNSLDLYFGRLSSFWYPLDGVLDDMRMYNRALSDAEIQAIYQL